MDIDKAKLMRIAVVTSITLVLMLAGQWIYTKYTIEKSLVNILSQKSWIEKADVKSDRGKVIVFVKFKDIDNFMEAYDDVYDTVNYNLKGKPFSILITNRPDSVIKDVYENYIQFIVHEAVQTGNYTAMRIKLDEIESEKKVKITTFINQRNVYIKIKHENYYFYYIVQRSN
ncbi:MAG: hypothetical protein PWR06_260 [Thermoanaerobacteraceae bacterium]|uniref:Uncharacterized protein n=1 Tax=Biomaibacter acetigenes TaxID=2316383 RepID=A0A3G2R502_9FIRM|nr:hypothetical protein [Biomaibacter acetigenes]AYO30526.1 hypothetical protein D2962_07735 [Biomaibacter acetigenes]MDK2877544.1 hypothetical protein [Thermoanaerobacteraceae bacterium]MDN5311887.1 hypothetical protein [Thermoanaerobacteraceae bacterium]RKL62039.1 hypothetical protein DXT63_13580 [Thermoanaerobacteraceae bacterium SP2]